MLEVPLLIQHDATVKFAFLNHGLVVQIRSTSKTRIHVSALTLKCLIPQIDRFVELVAASTITRQVSGFLVPILWDGAQICCCRVCVTVSIARLRSSFCRSSATA